MSKQKRNYNIARIRPTSYSHVYTNDDFERQDNKSNKFFSNLLHNYQKVSKGDQQTPKLTYLHLQRGNSGKIKAIEVELKHLQRKLPYQLPFFAQRNSFTSQQKRPSNYSLYLERSISRKSRRSYQKFTASNGSPQEISKSELFQPCKITPMKIQTRRIVPDMAKDHKETADLIRQRNKRGNSKMFSQLNVSKRMGEEMIEPWGLKNYQSIML